MNKDKKYKRIPLIITDYRNEDSLKLKCDGLIINLKLYSTFNDITYSFYEISGIIKKIKENKKKVFINMNRIIPENEVSSFKEVVKTLINHVDYIIYSDLSVLEIVDSFDYDKLIYDAKTLICNKEELSVFPTKAFISESLSFNEIKDFMNNEKLFSLDAFGYIEMMYSRRPLLSLVVPRGKVKTNTLYSLKEETRSEFYNIYETKRQKNNYGTYVYSGDVYVLLLELKDIFEHVEFIRLNSMFLGKIIDKVVNVYYKLLKDLENDDLDNYKEDFYIEKLKSILENNHLSLTRGFLDQESVLLKEDSND